MEDYDGSHSFGHTVGGYPPKPILVEQRKSTLMRSLTSLLIYALLFYFLFDRNIAYIAAILVVIIIHEMGHFAFMKLFRYSNVKIFIVPLLGAFTSGKKQEVSQFQLCLIILGGPVPGILIGSLIYYMNKDLHNETLKMLANSFLIINLLNCLPFYPLDGGRLIETLFFRQNHIIRLAFGIISIMALLALFLYAGSFIMLVVPVLIGMELYNENKHQKIREYLRQENINYHVDYKDLPDKDYWLIRDCLLFSFPKKYGGISPGVYEISIAEPLLIQHINSVLQIKLNYDLNTFQRLLVLFFYIAIFLAPFIFFRLSL
ncbi:MAG: peptidase [Bacteroidetes bacterium]|nr:peptidase [Bacteroidota bacterium]